MKILYIFILIIFILLLIKIKNYENKVNYISNSYNIQNINHIWMYWENDINKKKPVYLDLCFETVKKHCAKSFKIHLLNENSVYKYLPNLRRDINNLRIPQKADYIRLALLKKYGGIWLDSDIIVFKNLINYINLLKKHDFIGFGCHYKNCVDKPLGYPKPGNWVMVSRKNGILVSKCLEKADQIISSNYINLHLSSNYHKLGRELLWSNISELLKNSSWDYYHAPSTCLDRDSENVKWTNKRSISKEDIDNKCLNKLIFIPVYNTAPGFPKWFLSMSKNEILNSDLLISKMLNKSLNN